MLKAVVALRDEIKAKFWACKVAPPGTPFPHSLDTVACAHNFRLVCSRSSDHSLLWAIIKIKTSTTMKPDANDFAHRDVKRRDSTVKAY